MGPALTIGVVGLLFSLLCCNYADNFLRLGKRLISLKKNSARENPVRFPIHLLLLLAFVVLFLRSHLLDTNHSWQGIRVRILLGGIAFGQLALLSFKAAKSGRSFLPRFCFIFSIGLAAALFGHFTYDAYFSYRGNVRWTGVWQNPNTCGLLMSVALVLTLGQIMRLRQTKPAAPIWKILGLAIIGAIAALGLFRSFSRGAWVGAAIGLAYFIYQSRGPLLRRFPGCFPWLRRHRFTLAFMLVAVAALAWWGIHEAEWAAARRVASVSNPNDFSWRNRVQAWVGGLQMMTDKPWLGYGGWEPDRVYAQMYRHAFYGEHDPSILFNDYLVLGIIFGLPVLIFFLAYLCNYLADALTEPDESTEKTLRITCQTVVIIMLVGFFFDGGLFKIAPSVAFWVFWEMGRKPFDTPAQSCSNPAS